MLSLIIAGSTAALNIIVNSVMGYKVSKNTKTMSSLRNEVFVTEASTVVSLATQLAESRAINENLKTIEARQSYQTACLDDIANRLNKLENSI